MLASVRRDPTLNEAAAGAGELDGLVVGHLGAVVADELQAEVLGEDARPQPAGEVDAHGLRDAEPDLVGRPGAGGLGPADARGEGAEGAVARRVGVAADDDLAGQGEALLGQDLVADAGVDVEEVRNALFGHELADGSVVLGVLLVRGRDDVVEDDDDLARRLDLPDAELAELLDDGRGVVVGQDVVRRDGDDLAGLDVLAGVAAEDLFRQRFAHERPPGPPILRAAGGLVNLP